MSEFVIYALCDPQTNDVFYIGKGTKTRPREHIYEARWSKQSSHKLNKIRKIMLAGMLPLIKIYHQDLNEEDAYRLEMSYISLFGRSDLKTGILTNQNAGGRGNVEPDEAERLKRHKRKIGYKHTKESLIKMRTTPRTPMSDDTRKALSAQRKGKPKSETHRRNIGLSNKGSTRTEEQKQNISNACKNKPKFKCEFCDVHANASNLKRWHGENCKHYRSMSTS